MLKIISYLASIYPIDLPAYGELMRSYTNDVFLISTPSKQYVLKAYKETWRKEYEIEYEVALLNHLVRKGLRVSTPIMATDGQYVHPLEMLNGKCNVVLFECAEGRKPTPPFSLELYHEFGVAIARMHEMSNDFDSNFQRNPLNLKYLVDDPVNLVLPLLDENEDRLFLSELAEQITVRIDELRRYGLDWGPIHADATLDNLHVTDDDQIILYDFDSGGPGWRAADLQGWAKFEIDKEYADKWKMFQEGYHSIRELKEVDLQAAPLLHLSFEIWGIKIDLEQRILKQGTETTASYIQEQLRSLRQNWGFLLS